MSQLASLPLLQQLMAAGNSQQPPAPQSYTPPAGNGPVPPPSMPGQQPSGPQMQSIAQQIALANPSSPNSGGTGMPPAPPSDPQTLKQAMLTKLQQLQGQPQGSAPVPPWAAGPLAQQQAQSTAATYNPVSRPAGSYSQGDTTINQPLVQQAVEKQALAKWDALNPDFSSKGRFRKRPTVDDSTHMPLIGLIAKDTPLSFANVKGADETTPEDIAAMPAGPVRDALQRRQATLMASYGDFADPHPGTQATAADPDAMRQRERDEHLQRIEHRAGMRHDPLEREDKRYMGAKEFDTIHDAAEAKRSPLVSAVANGAAPGGSLMDNPDFVEFSKWNPQAAGEMLRSESEGKRIAAEGQVHAQDRASNEKIAAGNNAATIKHAEMTATEKSLDNDPDYKLLVVAAGEAAQLYRDGKVTRKDYDKAQGALTAYLQNKAQRRQQGAAPPPLIQSITQGGAPAPGIPGAPMPGASQSPGTVPPPAAEQTKSILDQSDDDIKSGQLPDIIDQLLVENHGRLATPFGPDVAGPLQSRLAERKVTPSMLRDALKATDWIAAMPGGAAQRVGGQEGDQIRKRRAFLSYLLGQYPQARSSY
jgi:hypothetical protein